MPLSKQTIAAFAESGPRGLLHLATRELQARLPPSLDYFRSFARTYLTRLCQTQVAEDTKEIPPAPPPEAEWATWILQAPPMVGLEYLGGDQLTQWWTELDALVRGEIKDHPGGAQAYLGAKNPSWRFVGRVTFHLAENKRDAENPFAFLATYASRLSSQGRVQHEVLGQALKQYAGTKNRQALLALLVPIQRAAERSSLVKELVDSGDVYHPLTWSPREAHRFLQDIPIFEESGLIVRALPIGGSRISRRGRLSTSTSTGGPNPRSAWRPCSTFPSMWRMDGEPLSEQELANCFQQARV